MVFLRADLGVDVLHSRLISERIGCATPPDLPRCYVGLPFFFDGIGRCDYTVPHAAGKPRARKTQRKRDSETPESVFRRNSSVHYIIIHHKTSADVDDHGLAYRESPLLIGARFTGRVRHGII